MPPTIASAINDFQRARRKANLQQVMSRLTGKSADLLSYEDVRRKLKAKKQIDLGLQDIPINKIVGSVGRYKDFTRTFLPKHNTDEYRWANLLVVNSTGKGLPPIELYKLGDAYFVLDGNHRVSIAREQGFTTIQAYVTEVITKVPITPDIEPDELIIKAEYAEFLDHTKLDELRPEADLTLTAPGKYALLEDHIRVHNYFMGINFQREIDWDEAVVHWYDEVYLPVIQMIRMRGFLRDFPNRTETDLYIWLAEHRAELETELGWQLETTEAVDALATAHKPPAVTDSLWELFVPDELEAGPPTGIWRRERLAGRDNSHLFNALLVSVGESDRSWQALDQAVAIAQREDGHLRGLHIINEHTDQTDMLAAFDHHVKNKGIAGQLAFGLGDVVTAVRNRARWCDLVVLALDNPPSNQMLQRYNSDWRNILHRSPRPVLAVPAYSHMQHALLAYDGSPKAKEALYVATYIAGTWHIPLTIVTAGKKPKLNTILEEAKQYLAQHNITPANCIHHHGEAAIKILLTAEKQNCDLIIMGGYGARPMVELIIGSTVDQVLRHTSVPVLVCR